MVTNPPRRRGPNRRGWIDRALEAIKRWIERQRDKSRDRVNPAEKEEPRPEEKKPVPPPALPDGRVRLPRNLAQRLRNRSDR